jgi:hypothetical protein
VLSWLILGIGAWLAVAVMAWVFVEAVKVVTR